MHQTKGSRGRRETEAVAITASDRHERVTLYIYVSHSFRVGNIETEVSKNI